jgi:hypothetical protein
VNETKYVGESLLVVVVGRRRCVSFSFHEGARKKVVTIRVENQRALREKNRPLNASDVDDSLDFKAII